MKYSNIALYQLLYEDKLKCGGPGGHVFSVSYNCIYVRVTLGNGSYGSKIDSSCTCTHSCMYIIAFLQFNACVVRSMYCSFYTIHQNFKGCIGRFDHFLSAEPTSSDSLASVDSRLVRCATLERLHQGCDDASEGKCVSYMYMYVHVYVRTCKGVWLCIVQACIYIHVCTYTV